MTLPTDFSGEPSRTAAECISMILESYRLEGLSVVLHARIGALGHERPVELMQTAEGRQRVYAWAQGLAEGIMG